MKRNGAEPRKYWRKRNEKGEIVNIIHVYGTDVEVADELYIEYSRMGRRMNYEIERERGKRVSCDVSSESAACLLHDVFSDSAEDVCIQRLDAMERKRLIKKLLPAIKQLSSAEKQVIHHLYWKQVSERELALCLGIPRSTLRDRHKATLKKLYDLMDL